MTKVALVLEGVGNPYEDACVEARDVVIERGSLVPRRGDVQVSGVSGSALALRGWQVVAESGASVGLSWGDVAIFLPQWRVRTGSGSVDLTAMGAPTVVRAEPHYPLLLTDSDWVLSGGTVGVNRLPNGDFRQGATGWTVIKGTVQMGWTGTGGYAAWFRGAGDSSAPYPSYAGIRSGDFTIDKTKSYSLLLESVCEPYDRYTYDNLPPQIVVRVWELDSGGNVIGSQPLLVYATQQAHATGGQGVWHRHLLYGGAIAPAGSGQSPRWSNNAAQARVEVYCNFNKQRVANLRLLEGGLAEWRVEGNRRIGRWVFAPSPEPLSCEVYATVNWTLTDTWALRLDYLRIYGIDSAQDEGVQLVLETESGERVAGRVLSYQRKDASVGGALQSVLYEGVEFDCSAARGQHVRRVGLSFGIASSTTESPVVEIGSPVVDAGSSDVAGFALYRHGGVGRGSAQYLLVESRVVGGLSFSSVPALARVELPVHNYHGVRVVGQRQRTDTVLRLYRQVAGGYYLVGERSTDGEIVDMGQVGVPYVAGGSLPASDLGVVWGGRLVVGKVGERVVWVSGQGQPLSFAESGYRDEDGYTLVLSERVRAIGAEPDALLIYGDTRVYRLTRYAPPIVLEDYTPLPDGARLADWGVVVSRGRVVVRGRIIKELPADFAVGGVRLGQDGSVFVWHASQPLAYVLTEDGWARWQLPLTARDALQVDGYWVIVGDTGCYRLCAASGRVGTGRWVSGWYAGEGMSRAVWVWLRGRASVGWRRLGAGSAISKVVEDDRWQVPTGGTVRAWRLELDLGASDVVYGLAVEGAMGEVR